MKCNHTTTRGKYDCFRGQALKDPLQTITKTHGFAVAVPHLTKFRTGATGQPVTEPVPTVTAGTSKRPGGNGHALGIVEAGLVPFLAGNGGSEYRAKPRPLDKPAHTILKESRACVVAPVIARQFGASVGHRADEPSATITAGGEVNLSWCQHFWRNTTAGTTRAPVLTGRTRSFSYHCRSSCAGYCSDCWCWRSCWAEQAARR